MTIDVQQILDLSASRSAAGAYCTVPHATVFDLVEEVKRLRSSLHEACDGWQNDYGYDGEPRAVGKREDLARLRAVAEGK